MAFIGKMVKESINKKPLVQVTFNPNINRISFLFRKGIVPAGSNIEVLIGTEEDAGYIKIDKGTKDATAVASVGKTGNVTSWGACRSVAATVLPSMRRQAAEVIADTAEYLLIKVPTLAAQAQPEAAQVVDVAANLGL